MSQAEYVAQQAADARAAIGNTLRAIAEDLKETTNVRLWARQHPWMTVGAAAAAGFVAACMVVPTQEDQALRRLAKIEKALNPQPAPSASSTNGTANQDEYKAGRQTLWTSFATELIGAVKPVLLSALTAGIAAKAAKEPPSSASDPPPSYSPTDPSI